jgi:hypothetical protein
VRPTDWKLSASSVLRGMNPDAHELARLRRIADEDEYHLVRLCRLAATAAVVQFFQRASLNSRLTRARLPEHQE